MSTYFQRTKTLTAALILALAMAFGLASTQQAYAAEGGELQAGVQVQADALAPIAYDGDTVMIVKEDLESELGMLSNPSGDLSFSRSLGKVNISFTPSNQTVYEGFYLNANIADYDKSGTAPTSWGDFVAATGSAGNFVFDFAIDESYCGKAWPIAPWKTEAKGRGTTSAQYYLAIPAFEKIEAAPSAYYTATVSSTSAMAPTVGDSGVIFADEEGNATLFVKIQNNQGKYDYLWKGTAAAAAEKDPSIVTDDMIKGIPVPAEPGFDGTTWVDEAGHYGVEGSTYKALLFAVPLTADELAAGSVNFQIRRSPWTPLASADPADAEKSSNAEKWMGTKDLFIEFAPGSVIDGTSSASLPKDNYDPDYLPYLEEVTAAVAAVPADATTSDLATYVSARDDYQEYIGLYRTAADVENTSATYKPFPYTLDNATFMATVLPEVKELLDAANASIPNVVPADGTYEFLANVPTGTNYGVNESHIASGRIPSATLVVADGKMKLTFQLTSKSYGNIYVGTPAEAAALEAAALAEGKTVDDVDYLRPDENNCVTVDLESLNKPIYLTWRSNSSKAWFVRGAVYRDSNLAPVNVAALAKDVDALMNDPFGKADGDVTDKAYRIDPWIVTEDTREAIEAANAKYAALTDDEKAAFDNLAVWDRYENEVPYGRVLEEAVLGLDALQAIDDATTLADGIYTGQPTVSFGSGKDTDAAADWSLVDLNVKGGKAVATIEDASGVYNKVKIGGKEYAKVAVEAAATTQADGDQSATAGTEEAQAGPSRFEIPVDFNAELAFVGLKQAMDSSNEVAYETGNAFTLKLELDEAAAKPNVAIEVPAAATGLKYTGKALGGVAAGEGYEVENGSAVNVGSYKATVTLKPGYMWADGTYDSQEIAWSIAKGVSTIKLATPKAVTFNKKAVAYSGKVTKTGSAGKVTYTYYSDKACKKVVKAANVKNAGTYYVKATVAADANYESAASAAVKLVINKASQTIKPAKTYTVKYSKAKKKAQKLSVKFTSTSKGKVTYTAAKTAGGKVSIAKNGKVTVKKGTKKGTYTLKVKVTAAAKGNYAKTTKTVKLKVKVA